MSDLKYYVYFYRMEDIGPDSCRKTRYPTFSVDKAIAFARKHLRFVEDHPAHAIIKGTDGRDYFKILIFQGGHTTVEELKPKKKFLGLF